MSVRVLVADDQAMVRGGFSMILGLEPDIEVVAEVSSGDEVLPAARKTNPDVALLDVQMPGRTGLELTRLIKADAALRATMVILLTAQAQASEVQAGLQAGADLYLTKPFSPLELLAAIDRAMGSA